MSDVTTSVKPKLAVKTLLCPISGESGALAQHPDCLIAKGFLGNGISIAPVGSRLVAPCKAKVMNIAATGHHITLGASNGLMIEIIVGKHAIDGHGIGFTRKVNKGDIVSANQVLIELDLIALKHDLPAIDVAVLVSKGALKLTPYHGSVRAGEDDIMQLIVKGA